MSSRVINRLKRVYRISVFMSNCNMMVQLIDDIEGKTVVSASTLSEEFREFSTKRRRRNAVCASHLGKIFAEKCKKFGIDKPLVFDRGSKVYKGCLKIFADSVREQGLVF